MTADLHQTQAEPPCEAGPIKTSDEVDQVFSALVGAQGDVSDIPMRGNNPHFRSKYVTLEDALKEVRPVLAKHGLAVLSGPMTSEARYGSVVRLCHKSGQWVELSAWVKASRGIQELGAVQTYLRRFCLAGLLNTAGDSDLDGEDVAGRAPAAKPQRKAPRPPSPAQEDDGWKEDFANRLNQPPPPQPAAQPAPQPAAQPAAQPSELRQHKTRIKSLMTEAGIKKPQWRKALDVASLGEAKSFPDLDSWPLDTVNALVAKFEISSKEIAEQINGN